MTQATELLQNEICLSAEEIEQRKKDAMRLLGEEMARVTKQEQLELSLFDKIMKEMFVLLLISLAIVGIFKKEFEYASIKDLALVALISFVALIIIWIIIKFLTTPKKAIKEIQKIRGTKEP